MFLDHAIRYLNFGFSPIPVKEKQKAPAIARWQTYCSARPNEDQLEKWNNSNPNYNVGVCLGTKITDDYQLGCIDIDSEDFVSPALHAINGKLLTKKGAKGISIFVRAPAQLRNIKLKANIDGKKSRVPVIEILLSGSQTVMPPSVHPNGAIYKWVDKEPRDLEELPLLDEWTLDELKAFCGGEGEHFHNLNQMVWAGVGGGGDTHDICVAATASMVSRGWEDGHIHHRIERAKESACARAGEVYDWPDATKTIQEWINSARNKGMTGTKKKSKIPKEREMAIWALEELGGMDNVATVDGVLRKYEDGYWQAVNVEALKQKIYVENPLIKEGEAKSAIKILHTLTMKIIFGRTENVEPQYDPMRQRVCLQNGTLNLKTGNLELHNSEHELIHQLNFDWDESATCPEYDKVLNFTFNGDDESINLWDEFCALTLIDDMSFQKILFLKGPGGNGKGTLARVLRNMHDPSAVGSVAITDLNSERKRTSLIGKLLNISGEQSRLNLVSDTYLKKITGEDPIDTRMLYQETRNNVILSVRFLELVNEMPSTSDSSHALRRRIMILNCPNKVTVPDAHMDDKLFKERPGILNRWVGALKRLYHRGGFHVPQSSIDEVDQYLLENDSVQYWLTQRTEPLNGKHPLRNQELYADYFEWARVSGYKYIFPEVLWGRRLTTLGHPTRIKKIGGKSSRVRELMLIDDAEF